MSNDHGGEGGPDPAPLFPCPARGQIITYVPSEPVEVPVLHRGTATGGVLTDPVTGSRWLPVIRPDLLLDLVDVARVVVSDPATGPRRPPREADPGTTSPL
jgi:hypothetical protein